MDFTKFILLASIAEALWETTKLVWERGKINVDRIGAIAVGILIALAAKIDLFDLIEVPISVPYLGRILTGLMLSRGANFLHDLVGSISTVYANGRNRIN